MYILGIDPGLTGAVTVLDSNGEFVRVYDTPTVEATYGTNKGKKKRSEFDTPEMRRFLLDYGNDGSICIIEKVGAMRGQGVTGMFRFGYGYGLWIGLLSGVGIPLVEVSPIRWKKAFNLIKANKDKSVEKALKIFPDMKEVLFLKKHHNRADSALLAKYCYDTEVHN